MVAVSAPRCSVTARAGSAEYDPLAPSGTTGITKSAEPDPP